MTNQIINISREELYKKVWEKPLSELSKEFGVSDVWLKKLCRRNGIPTPPQGYHLMADKVRKKRLIQSLPNLKPGQKDHFQFSLVDTNKPLSSASSDQDRWVEYKDQNLNAASKKQISEIDKVLKRLRKLLHLRKTDDRGILRVPKEHPVRVAPERLSLALETLRELFIKLVDYGASEPDYDPEKGHNKLSVKWLGYSYSFRIEEFSHRVLKPKSEWPDPKSRWYSDRDRFNLVPNGKLQLAVNPPGVGSISARDGRTFIKDRLDDVVMKMFIAANKKTEKDRIEAIRRERALAFLKQKDEERREQEFQVLKQKQLIKEARRWHRVNELRQYLEALEKAGSESGRESFGNQDEWAEWMEWSRGYLDSIDTVKNGKAGAQPGYPQAREITSVPWRYLEVDDPEEAEKYYQ